MNPRFLTVLISCRDELTARRLLVTCLAALKRDAVLLADRAEHVRLDQVSKGEQPGGTRAA